MNACSSVREAASTYAWTGACGCGRAAKFKVDSTSSMACSRSDASNTNCYSISACMCISRKYAPWSDGPTSYRRLGSPVYSTRLHTIPPCYSIAATNAHPYHHSYRRHGCSPCCHAVSNSAPRPPPQDRLMVDMAIIPGNGPVQLHLIAPHRQHRAALSSKPWPPYSTPRTRRKTLPRRSGWTDSTPARAAWVPASSLTYPRERSRCIGVCAARKSNSLPSVVCIALSVGRLPRCPWLDMHAADMA